MNLAAAAAGAPLLEVADIHTYYGDSYVLQGVSIQVHPGHTVGIMGRNGVGKTTLLRSIVGFTPPARGRVLFKSQDIAGMPAFKIRRLGIGLVPQGRRVFGGLTVQENLKIGTRPGAGAQGRAWSMERAMQFFPRLAERAHHGGNKLSGGEQQMLASVRPLVAQSDLLLLDEPTEGLAPLMVQELLRLLITLRAEGYTMLLVEQSLDILVELANTVYVIDHGTVVWHGSPAALNEDKATKEAVLGL